MDGEPNKRVTPRSHFKPFRSGSGSCVQATSCAVRARSCTRRRDEALFPRHAHRGEQRDVPSSHDPRIFRCDRRALRGSRTARVSKLLPDLQRLRKRQDARAVQMKRGSAAAGPFFVSAKRPQGEQARAFRTNGVPEIPLGELLEGRNVQDRRPRFSGVERDEALSSPTFSFFR